MKFYIRKIEELLETHIQFRKIIFRPLVKKVKLHVRRKYVKTEEYYGVLKEMKVNKSPGNDDGFTAEFYCTFWSGLGDIKVGALNESYDKKNAFNVTKTRSYHTYRKGRERCHVY